MGQAMLYPERVAKIKDRRQQLGWSCQHITDIVLDAGDITSVATVKRILSAGSEELRFKDSTLLPIEKALGLLDEKAIHAIPPATEEFYRSIIKDQNEQLKELRHSNKAKDVALAFLLTVLFGYLFMDLLTPNAGWYREESATGWIIKAVLLLAFILAAGVYTMLKRRRLQKKK